MTPNRCSGSLLYDEPSGTHPGRIPSSGAFQDSVTQNYAATSPGSQNDVAALLDELVTPLPVEIPAVFARSIA